MKNKIGCIVLFLMMLFSLSGCAAWDRGVKDFKSDIHMPKEAARIFLKVTDVRVERLQDITEEQAEREGTQYYCPKCESYRICGGDGFGKSCFKKLWNSTVDKKQLEQYGWDANPYVWVIEFKRCEKPERED